MLGCPTSDTEIPFLDLLCEVSKVPFSITTHRLCHTAPVWSAPSRVLQEFMCREVRARAARSAVT